MRYFNRLILIITIFFSFTNASISKENIGFVNVDYLIQNSNIGKKVIEDIENFSFNTFD